MKLVFDGVCVARDEWILHASGIFNPGVHLISGRVGAGKTTLSLIAAGLLLPGGGEVIREGIGNLMLSMQFPEYQTTGRTLLDEAESWGSDTNTLMEISGFMERAGVDPLQLSRGELKRFHLACILSRDWDLLILDEPFSSLDCREKTRMCARIAEMNSCITLICTHEQWLLPRVDEIWEIHEGKLVHCGPVPEGIRNWRHAPAHIRRLVEAGCLPDNIDMKAILEVACRTRE